MAAKIKTLFDKLGNKLYPKTKTSAVYNDSNVVLDTILNGKQNATDNNLETTSKTVIGAINEVNSALIDIDGNGTTKVAVNPSTSEITSFEEGAAWVETPPPIKSYLEFSSDEDFTLSVSSPGWNGTIEYSLDKGNTWNTWDGTQLSGDEDNSIYLRGIGNTKITGGILEKWSFTGKCIIGNIETLLDYQTVASGQYPIMSSGCYQGMFWGCSSLITPPKLPATTLAGGCYQYMFQSCTSLTTAPELPATILAGGCYAFMFRGCTSLKLSTTQDPNIYKYPYRIPTSNTGTDADNALSNMFDETGGTFTGTPTINTTYYIDHEPISSDVSVDPNELCIKINNSEKRLNLDENIADKLDKYASGSSDWDTTPTQNSTKAVTSGGVYSSLNNITSKINDIDGGGTSKVSINPSASEIAGFDNGSIWIETT